MIDDLDDIIASFAKEYGIDLETNDELTWCQFSRRLSRLGPNTALGRLVQIRTEKDGEVIKHWPPSLKRENANWQHKQRKLQANSKTMEESNDFIAQMAKGFRDMANGVKPKMEKVKKEEHSFMAHF